VDGDDTVEVSLHPKDAQKLLRNLAGFFLAFFSCYLSQLVTDLDGGKIQNLFLSPTLSLLDPSSPNPFSKLETDASMVEIFRATRGAKVMIQKKDEVLEGTILSCSSTETPCGPDISNLYMKFFLQLIEASDDEFVLAVPIEEIVGFRFLDGEVAEAYRSFLLNKLQVKKAQRQTLAIQCSGDGKRTIRAEYLGRAAEWTSSYLLQGHTLSHSPISFFFFILNLLSYKKC